MVSILTALLFFCGCLCAQASAQGPLFTLNSVARYDLGTRFQFRAEYESSQTLDVEWEGPGDKSYEPGVTTLDFDKTVHPLHSTITLTLGDLKSQTFRIHWNLNLSGNLSATLDMTPSVVTPGTDVIYNPGTPVDVTVAVEHLRGNGHLRAAVPQLRFDAARKFEDTFIIYAPSQPTPFSSVSHTELGDSTTNTVQFAETGSNLINALVSATWYYQPTVRFWTSPMMGLSETTLLTVRDSSHTGPWPAEFVHVGFFLPHRNAFTCPRRLASCSLQCYAFGNDLTDIQIRKENGQAMGVNMKISGYMGTASVNIDPNDASTPGNYVCQGIMANGNAETTLAVTVD